VNASFLIASLIFLLELLLHYSSLFMCTRQSHQVFLGHPQHLVATLFITIHVHQAIPPGLPRSSPASALFHPPSTVLLQTPFLHTLEGHSFSVTLYPPCHSQTLLFVLQEILFKPSCSIPDFYFSYFSCRLFSIFFGDQVVCIQ